MYMGENPVFLNEKMSKIGKDVVVRCIVMGGGGGGGGGGVQWLEAEPEFRAVVSLKDDGLGPVSD